MALQKQRKLGLQKGEVWRSTTCWNDGRDKERKDNHISFCVFPPAKQSKRKEISLPSFSILHTGPKDSSRTQNQSCNPIQDPKRWTWSAGLLQLTSHFLSINYSPYYCDVHIFTCCCEKLKSHMFLLFKGDSFELV